MCICDARATIRVHGQLGVEDRLRNPILRVADFLYRNCVVDTVHVTRRIVPRLMTEGLGMEKHRRRGLDVSRSDTSISTHVPRKPSKLRWMHPEQQLL